MTLLDLRRGTRRREQLLEQFGVEMLTPVRSEMPRSTMTTSSVVFKA